MNINIRAEKCSGQSHYSSCVTAIGHCSS